MFCINCGKQLEEGSRFCPYCGAKVPDLTFSAPANPPYPNDQSLSLIHIWMYQPSANFVEQMDTRPFRV